ncbi:hypothetical protein EG328_004130 [Venturia inaequalis]|uniref:Rhodanese domain-containing protein n=1 Tax=Venturia inaequalis TaxID=5025 RepID=A0A8H3VG19_VENIN|nr:hypothetical protein EG328_004130 [Venturia inaequalis]
MADSTKSKAAWYAAYPVARTQNPAAIDRAQVLQLIKESTGGPQSYGGTIRGSINLPAQSLFPSIPTLYAIFKAAGVEKVIWYCGSSKGRGTRGAAWFADHIENEKDDRMQSLVLTEGVRGWATAGEEYAAFMDEYEKDVWEKSE